MNKFITGAGGGGGGSGSSRASVEDPDSLASKSYARIIDLLGEGEWEEVPVGGLKGFYLNEVVAQNADGTDNFSDVVLETRTGSLAQTRMNIADTTEASFGVGVEATYNAPVEKQVYGESVDQLRVVVSVPALSSADSGTGDIRGTSVSYKIEYNSSDNLTFRPANVGGGAVTSTSTLVPGAGPFTGWQEYSLTFTVYPARYYTTSEVLVPCVYQLRKKTNGGVWVVVKEASVSSVSSLSYTTEALSSDSVDFDIVVADASGISLDGSVLSLCYGQITGIESKTFASADGVVTISGKTTSTYERETAFRVSGTSPYTVRVTRQTPDSTTSYLNNKTVFQSVSVVTEEKFVYPGSVLAGVSVDATQFSSIPSRAYKCKMLKVKVPNNYDPIARSYTGFWNGGFKVAWTDNPAWCFYDLLTNKRYGLGERIPESYVDKAALYQIAQYCDEYVPDGNGGFEPRFTCNLYLNNQKEAYKIISDMATIFRGITYWASGSIVPVQDSQKEKIYAFNNTNVIDGIFNYQSSDINTRYNAVSVTWNDPINFYKQAVEYVADDAAIAEMGFVNHTNIVAFGCTSRSMARRAGKWLLYTNTYETDAVTFSTGLEGVLPRPGDVIEISDTLRSSERRGGRLVSVSGTSVVLDAELQFNSGTTYTLSAIDEEGNVIDATFSASTTTANITLNAPFPATVAKDSIYVIADNEITPQKFRLVSIAEKDSGVYELSGVSYNAAKYDMIENDERLTTVPNNNPVVGMVEDVVPTEVLYAEGTSVKSKLRIDWKVPSKAVTFDVYIIKPDGERVLSERQRNANYELLNTFPGTYKVSITAYNVLGSGSQAYTEDVLVLGKTAPPSAVENLVVRSSNGVGTASWATHKDLDVLIGGKIVVKYTTKTSGITWEDGIVVAEAPGGATQVTVPLLTGTYTTKAVDADGNYSNSFVSASSAYAEVMSVNVMESLVESPAFSGTKTNCTVSGGALHLIPIDGDTLTAEYLFSDVIDLLDVYSVRVSGQIEGSSSLQSDTINSRLTPINTWNRFNGDVINGSTLSLYISTTQTDPSGSPVWSAWEELRFSDYTARGFRFKAVMGVENALQELSITSLFVSVDAVDRVAGEDNISVPSGGYAVVFDGAFAKTPAIAISIDNLQVGDYYRITSKSASGFIVRLYDSTGTPKAGQIDWLAKGWGRKI